MKDTLFGLMALAAILCHMIVPAHATEENFARQTEGRPNILFILVDDLGWTDVGYNGATYHKTPNIDKLSQQALVFDRAYARPTCSPTRASLFTGLNAAHTKIYHVGNYYRVAPSEKKIKAAKSGHHYDEPITMMSDALKQAGYATGYVGKWHVTKAPTNHGFDFNAGGWGNGGPKSYFSPYRNPALENGPRGEYLPDRLANECIAFMERKKDEPFFLCYAPYSVHYPNQAKQEDIERFENRTKQDERQLPVYAAMVYAADRAIGRVIDSLESLGIDDNTLIVLTSDNGVNGRSGISTPLRGSKGSVYEGGVRVPAMVSWPGITKARRTKALVDIIDWYPTLVEVAGAELPSHELDGISLVPLFKGELEKVRDTMHMHVPVYNGSRGKVELNPFFQSPASVGFKGKYKFVRNYEPDRPDELFDLEADVGEQDNLAHTNPEILKQMSASMDKWLADNEAVLPTVLTEQVAVKRE